MNSSWFWLAVVSALFSAASTVMEKKSLFSLNAAEFSLAVSVFLFFLSLPFFSIDTIIQVDGWLLLVLFLKTLLASVSFLLVMNGIKKSELSSSLPLMVLTPGLVAICAFIFLGDALTMMQVVGMILLLAGTLMLQQTIADSKSLHLSVIFRSIGHRYMWGALILYTLTSLLDKTLLSNYHFPLNDFMVYQHFFQVMVFIPVFYYGSSLKKSLHKVRSVWITIVLAAVFTLIYRYTQFAAIQTGPVALILSVKRVSVFFAILVAGKMFHEKHLLLRTLATIMMLTGAFLIALM